MTASGPVRGPRIRVVLADDEAVVRAGVATVLAAAPDLEVVAEAADGHRAVAQVLRHRPDVALLDIQMPHLDGIAVAKRLRTLIPNTALVVLTTFGDDEHIARALDAGVDGFLLKSGDPWELVAGIRAVATGAACLSPDVARRVISELGDTMGRAATARARIAVLTPREREVLALVGAGLSNADIARRLFLVEGTVKQYVSAILAQLQADNRVQAAIVAHEAGLVDREG